jgi:YVTN family beta-propeller protein
VGRAAGIAGLSVVVLISVGCSSKSTLSRQLKHKPGSAQRRALARHPTPRPVRQQVDLYAKDRKGMLSAAVESDPPRIYVPNSESDSVDVIDPRTYRVVEHFGVGLLPQHITPAYDLKKLYVLDDAANTVTPIDPVTTLPGDPVSVDDPYNLYFPPDGRFAIVVAERLHRLDF